MSKYQQMKNEEGGEWKKRGIDYDYFKDDLSQIILLKKYTGLRCCYDKNCRFIPDGDEYRLQFKYDLTFLPEGMKYELAELEKELGDILMSLMHDNYEVREYDGSEIIDDRE